jgi:DNA-directed RNA polymerase III subunit RPC3
MLDPEIHIDEHAPELDDDVVHSVEDSVAAHSNQRNNQENDDTSPAVSTARRAERHLQTLVCDPQGFVQMSQGQWRVPFHPISQRIIEEEIETIITHNLGTLPARMVRILKFYGHQELRHLAARAMVTEDHARTACTELHKSGWIDVMELPRTARREVTKSLWLWSYDVLKARQKCLADCYFTMSRLSMRLQRERQEIERVIDKSERTDVQGNEDKFLGPSEKATLARFEKQTDMIVRQMVRMDEVVAIMRDFSAMEYPHKLWDHGWVHWQSPSPDAAEAKRRADAEGRGDDEADDEDDEGSAEP